MSSSNHRNQVRQNSGGYDFGGYVPGADYTPRKRPKWQVAVALLCIVALVGFTAILF